MKFYNINIYNNKNNIIKTLVKNTITSQHRSFWYGHSTCQDSLNSHNSILNKKHTH